MAWADTRNPDYAMVRGTVGMPGSPGYGVNQVLQYLGGPRDKLMKEEAEKERQLRLQMQQVSMEPFRARQAMAERLMAGMESERVGGQMQPQPAFNPSPVYTDQQMKQQVNAAQAANESRGATAQRQLQDSSGSRGFGAASPAVQALSRQIQMQTMGANATAAREIPFQAAQANADSMFRGQQLQHQRWQGAEDSDIRRRQLQFNKFQSMLSLLGG